MMYYNLIMQTEKRWNLGRFQDELENTFGNIRGLKKKGADITYIILSMEVTPEIGDPAYKQIRRGNTPLPELQ